MRTSTAPAPSQLLQPGPEPGLPPPPDAAVALWLADRAATGDTAFVAADESQLHRLATSLPGFCAGRAELLVLPGWDVLPYDSAPPAAGIVGRRLATLARLRSPATLPRLLLTGADATLQRVPPPGSRTDPLVLACGDTIDESALRHALGERGYHVSETVTEPGEVAFHGHRLDLFAASDAEPVRLAVEDGRIAAIHRLDPATQLSGAALPGPVCLFPATEFPLDPADADHLLLGHDTPAVLPSGRLVPVFDDLSGFAIFIDPGVPDRWADLHGSARDAHAASRRMHLAAGDGLVLPPPERLFLTPARAAALCGGTRLPAAALASAEPQPRRVKDLVALATATQAAAIPVVVAAPGDPHLLARSLAKRGLKARAATTWAEATAGGVACLDLDIDTGLRSGTVLVLQAAHLLRHHVPASATLLEHDAAPRLGDVVVHQDHGTARLESLKPHDGAERIALCFADGGELLAAPEELNRIWRYGSAGTLDRLGGRAWEARRSAIEAEIAATAAQLAERTAARAARTAPVMAPDAAAYDRLARRFPHPLSPDQATAVDAVLADLRSGRPMDRLVCGDVGFGKTEVALRAAAAVALSGHQVAIVAPTTVLARQHLHTVQARFAGTGLRVAALMGAAGPENRETRNGLADGTVDIVVGTQAIASAGVRPRRLGLVVIDEEQRFGEKQKGGLADPGAHLLVMTATPIPRTMQSALIGLREVSVIATPPRARQPTRTFVLPWDEATVREALRREHARGGQSFVVCPRISAMKDMAARLARLVPGQRIVQAHGRMSAEELDEAVVGFSAGGGDILLATNIIEAGLDIPRANTILVTEPDRFGLAQLHQMRGRVGRGTRRGAAFLLTEPGRTLTDSTRIRLRTLEQLGSLHAGVAIAAADMDQRGAGEMFGEAQAGHVSALGTDLYHHLLHDAVARQAGNDPAPSPPDLHVGLTGRIPEDMVPEPDLRLALYRRLFRLPTPAAIEDFAHEMHDRFGEPGPQLEALLLLARLRCTGTARRLARIDAGPRGAALLPHDPAGIVRLAYDLGGLVRDNRLLLDLPQADAAGRVEHLISVLSSPTT